jgi:protein-tyrosine phosphatase
MAAARSTAGATSTMSWAASPKRGRSSLVIQRIPNCRPLTTKPNTRGQTLKDDLILRSASPSPVRQDAAKLFEALGIRHVYDFRNRYEVEREGSLALADVTSTQIDVIGNAGADPRDLVQFLDDPEKAILKLYRDVFPMRREFGHFVQAVVAQATPAFLFHCTAGKDRTGVAATILLHLLDCGVDAIYEEYVTVDPTVVQQVTRQMTGLAAWAGRELGEEALNVLASVQPGLAAEGEASLARRADGPVR